MVMIRTKTGKFNTTYKTIYSNFLTKWSGNVYLSSKLNMEYRVKQIKQDTYNIGTVLYPEGPSLTTVLNAHIFDHTYSFVYHCPNIITRWVAARNGDWPPQDVKLKVASLPAFLVPIGQKGAPDEDLQWRICFNLGELVLVNSLNNTQFKVYLILKVWKKMLLGTLCKSMTFQDIMEHETMKLFKCDECASLVVSGAES